MKNISLLLGFLALLTAAGCSEEVNNIDDLSYGEVPVAELLQRTQLGSGDWQNLLMADSLEGWTVKIRGHQAGDNYRDSFQVDNGVLRVSYQGYDKFGDRFGHLFYDQPFSHYILSLDYRFLGEQAKGGAGWAFENSGVMVHSQSAQSMGLEQNFPISVEVQLLGGTGEEDRPTANVCTPGTHIEISGTLRKSHCIESRSATYPGAQWVHLDLVVLGNDLIEHRINGDSVLHYQKPVIGGGMVSDYEESEKPDGQALSQGFISLQSESHPVEFRNIELLDLSGCGAPQAANYRSYLAVNDSSTCDAE
jgi:hypothetical protein